MKRILKDADGNIFESDIISGAPEGYEDITDIMEIDVAIEDEEKKYLEAAEVAEVVAVAEVFEVVAEDAVPAIEYVAPVAAIEAVAYIAPVIEVVAVAENWSNGTEVVFDVNDIPTLIDGETDEAYLDPDYLHVDAVEAVAPVEEVLAVEAVAAVEEVLYVAEIPAVEAVAAAAEVIGVARHFVISKKTNADKDRRNAILDILRQKRVPLLAEADILISIAQDTAASEVAERAYRQELREVTATYIKVDGDPKVAVDNIDLENFVWPTKP